MKKIFKSRIFTFVLGAVIFSGIAVFATEEMIESNDVRYKNKTVEASLDELYVKANAKNLGAEKICKLIDTTYGRFASVGSEYECTVGTNDGTDIKYNFYLLAENNDNTVDLIMDSNINSGTLDWNNTMKYIDNNNLKTNWENVLNVDLPEAQAIANAVGRTEWKAAENSNWWYFDKNGDSYGQTQVATSSNPSNYAWLFNHLNNCTQAGCTDASGGSSYGYWTRDLISNTARAWRVNWDGGLNNNDAVSNADSHGVRPVIIVLKTNLYSE